MDDMTLEEAIALADNWLTSGGDPGIGMIALKTLRNEVRKRQWVPVGSKPFPPDALLTFMDGYWMELPPLPATPGGE